MLTNNLFKYYFIREIKEKYLGNITGIFWLLLQPVILLLMYWFVFDKIFNARVPEALHIGFIVYLALGFWPWLAFSESVTQSITSVENNSDLIGKNNIDFKIPVLATISATYALNIINYIIVLSILSIFYDYFDLLSILLLVIPILQLYFFSIAIGLFLSATQIFIKDTISVMTTIMTLWFFATPIIYSETIIPDKYLSFMKLNPLYTPISFIHKVMISKEALPWSNMIYLSIFILVFLIFSIKYFNKLSNYFEDYK